MAGSIPCFVCKSSLESCVNVVSLWSAQSVNPSSNGFRSAEPWLCHQDCFLCSVCNSLLEDKEHAYGVSVDEKLLCSKHCYGLNVENGSLTRALNDFKDKSLSVKAALENNESTESCLETTRGISEVSCSCGKPKSIEQVAGYRVECIEKNCPIRNYISKQNNHHFETFSDHGSVRDIGKGTSVSPEEIYGKCFYGIRHWTFCAREDDVGVVLFILKPESNPKTRGSFRIMVRSSYYLVFGLLTLSNQHGSKPSREEVVQFLSQQVKVKSSVKAIWSPSAKADLLKMDSAFVKHAYKFGVVYMKENQQTEEELFGNETHSKAFDDFLDLLGERVRLQGFNKYRAGLDSNNDLTGTHSVYTKFHDKEVMFHVSTLLPFEEFDVQKLQRKRHIGNDIACIVFMEATNTKFVPDCIKSNFLHSFIIVQVDVEKNPHLYTVSVVSKADVLFFDPPLHEKHVFEKNEEFRDWILEKLIQAEQACHRVPSFARLHARTRELIMEGLLKSAEMSSHTEQIRNSFPNFSPVSSPNGHHLHQNHHHHITAEQVTRDFSSVGSEEHNRGDTVAFLVGDTNQTCFIGVKSVMMAKSKVFHKVFSQDLSHNNWHTPVTNTSPPTSSPVVKRAASWRSSHMVHTGHRSGKVNLEKMRRCKSLNEAEDPQVILESFTDFDNKKDRENSGLTSHLHWQEVITVKLFQSDVFEALLEYLHCGSCDLVPSVIPGLLSAAQYYEVEELHQVCLERIKEANNSC